MTWIKVTHNISLPTTATARKRPSDSNAGNLIFMIKCTTSPFYVVKHILLGFIKAYELNLNELILNVKYLVFYVYIQVSTYFYDFFLGGGLCYTIKMILQIDAQLHISMIYM